ncbi:PDZ domain-containing protein [Anatilimnocola aggregata]|nr:PDZ domain-containing protein [Anatilimnocola aggregata]
MSTTLSTWLKTLSAVVPAALLSAALYTSPANAQNVPPPAKDAREAVKDAREEVRDTTRDAREAVRDTKNTVKDPRDPRDPARDLSRDARDPRNTTREETRDTVRDGREAVRDTRDAVRDNVRDARENTRDTVRDARAVRASFRADGTRPADFGLWFNRNLNNGLVIADIASQGAISKLGLREGDRVISVNGRKVATEADFVSYIFADDVRDQQVKVIVMRDGREEVVVVEPNLFIDELAYVDNDPLENFGVVIDDRYTDRIVVWRVIPRSPAYYAGIRAGDVIVSLGDQRVTGVQNLVQRLTGVDVGNVQVQVSRGQNTRTYEVDVPRFEARSERRNALRPNFDAEDRRDDRLDRREERIDDRRDNRAVPAPRVQGGVEATIPAPAVPAVNPPAVIPAPAPAVAPAPAPAPRPAGSPAPRPGLFPRNKQ